MARKHREDLVRGPRVPCLTWGFVAHPAGFEPATVGLEVLWSRTVTCHFVPLRPAPSESGCCSVPHHVARCRPGPKLRSTNGARKLGKRPMVEGEVSGRFLADFSVCALLAHKSFSRTDCGGGVPQCQVQTFTVEHRPRGLLHVRDSVLLHLPGPRRQRCVLCRDRESRRAGGACSGASSTQGRGGSRLSWVVEAKDRSDHLDAEEPARAGTSPGTHH